MATSTPRHSTHGGTVRSAGDVCPWCSQPISHSKFLEIRTRIAKEERERSERTERTLRERMAAERTAIQTQADHNVETARAEAAEAILKAEKGAVARAAAAHAEGLKSGKAALGPKLVALENDKAKLDKHVRDLTTSRDAEIAKRTGEARAALEKAHSDSLAAEKARAFKEKLKLEQSVSKLHRQLEQKTADELGEGGEVDLFEDLKAAFPDDRVNRVQKGTPGADIIHRIVHNGRVCGQIVYDSKNRGAWRNEYVTKLRQDQLAAKADHAVLSTQVFPSGARQVHVQGGVIVANPARVLALVQVLRRHVVQLHSVRASVEARAEKVTKLYDFINSERCAQILDQVESLANEILDLDVAEKKAHDLTWRRRGEKARSLLRAHATLVSEIELIIGVADEARSA